MQSCEEAKRNAGMSAGALDSSMAMHALQPSFELLGVKFLQTCNCTDTVFSIATDVQSKKARLHERAMHRRAAHGPHRLPKHASTRLHAYAKHALEG